MANVFKQYADEHGLAGNPFEQRAKMQSAIQGALADQAAGIPTPQGPVADVVATPDMVPTDTRIRTAAQKALAAVGPQPEPEPVRPMHKELYRAIGRGGIKGIAAVPGTLATLMEAGEQVPGSWGAWGVPGEAEKREKTIKGLRRKARDIYKLSEVESMRATRGGAGGFVINLVGESVPQFGMSTVAAVLGGPAGLVATSAAMGGEEVYQNLRDLGVSHEKANAARWVTAPIIGLVEKWQIDGILASGNKKLVKEFVEAARTRAFKKMAQKGVDITFDEAMRATADGVQEVIQEGVGITAEVATGRDLDIKQDLIRLGGAGFSGLIVGETLRGGVSAIRGGASVLSEIQKQRDVDVTERMAVEQELRPPTADEPIAAPIPEVGPGGEGLTPTVTEGMPETPAEVPANTLRPTRDLKSEPGYVYHATNEENLQDIADTGSLDVHAPDYGTEQDAWPDGAVTDRAYFSRNAGIVGDFAPAEGKPVVVRAKEGAADFKTESTGDVYTEAPVPASSLEVLTTDGWKPLQPADTAAPTPEKPRMRVMGELGRTTTPSDVEESVSEPPVAQPETGTDPERPYMATRNSDMEVRSQWMGNPPVPEQIPAGTYEGRRQAAVEGGYDQRAPDIANDILNDPRPATSEETHGLDIRAEQIEAEHDQLAQQLEAMGEGDINRDTVVRRMGELEEQHGVITKVLRWAGTEWSAAGFARQHRLGDNANALNVIGRAVKAKGGRELDADTKADFQKQSRKLARKRQRAKASTQKDTRNRMRQLVKQATSRYAKMSDADKDAELADLLSREQTDLVVYNVMLNVASRMEGADLEAVSRAVLQHFPGMERSHLTDAVMRAMDRRAQNTDSMTQYLRALRRKYRKVKQLRTDIADVLYWMEQGRLPDKAQPIPGDIPDTVIQRLQDTLDNLKRLQRESEPAEQQRLERRIAFLKARLASRDFDTKKNATRHKPSEKTLRLQYEMARLDAEINQQIRAQREVDPLWHALSEASRTVMALKSSFDLSALGNQGGWVLLSHPVRALRTLPKALRAAVSDQRAHEINAAIRNRPNSVYYFRDGLELTETSEASELTDREELFRSTWIRSLAKSKVPGIRHMAQGVLASDRAFSTTLNLLRADSYDAMAAAFADEGGPTPEEGRAIADFINMATGRGTTRGPGMKQMMNRMNGIFWAPRRALSRFQMLATVGGQLEYRRGKIMPVGLRGTRKVRRMFAKELGRYLAGLATVYFLGQLAGGELEWNTRSSDFGKIRFDDTRLDPLSGMSQTLTLLGRMTFKERKDQFGNVQPLSGYDMERTVGQFLKNKVSPAFTIAWAGYTGDTPFDGDTTPLWVAKEAVTPIALDDIYEVMRDQGVPRGTVLSMLGILGIGVQVYGENTVAPGRAPGRGMF